MKTPTVSQIGEDALVSEILASLPGGPRVRVAAGDDCAVIGAAEDARWTLLKTDCVIEGVHFTPETAPERIGRKALGRALSDIAAMGGTPAEALITLGLPGATEVEKVRGIYAGLAETARQFDVAIVGGETARTPGPLFLSVALTGWVNAGRCILRSGGRPGDGLYVTGVLGGSLAAHHLEFTPRLEEGQWLAKKEIPRCMMDLSDGLGSDLPRLARACGCGFALDRAALPCRAGSDGAAAVSDGEDYELLFAVPETRAAELETAWPARFPEVRLSRIGQLTDRETETLAHGFDHFAQP